MKKLIFLICFLAPVYLMAQQQPAPYGKPDPAAPFDTLEASCGMCQFDVKAKDCFLAVRLNGSVYTVEGTDIDSHGDAHAPDGFCSKIRKAEVQGKLLDNKMYVTYFRLLPLPAASRP